MRPALAIVATLLALTACSDAGSAGGSTRAQTAEPTTTTEPEGPPGPGATVEVAGERGVAEVTVRRLIDPAPSSIGSDPGLVAVEVMFVNRSTEPYESGTIDSMTLVGADESELSEGYDRVDGCPTIRPYLFLQPGDVRAGCAVFAAPAGFEPVLFQYRSTAERSTVVLDWDLTVQGTDPPPIPASKAYGAELGEPLPIETSGTDLEMTVIDVAEPVSSEWAGERTEVVAVTISFTHRGGEPMSYSVDHSIALIDSDGHELPSAFGGATGCPKLPLEPSLSDGASVEGCVIYEVPEGTTLAAVQFSEGVGHEETARWNL